MLLGYGGAYVVPIMGHPMCSTHVALSAKEEIDGSATFHVVCRDHVVPREGVWCNDVASCIMVLQCTDHNALAPAAQGFQSAVGITYCRGRCPHDEVP